MLSSWEHTFRLRPRAKTRIKALVHEHGLDVIPAWAAAALLDMDPSTLASYARRGAISPVAEEQGITFYLTEDLRVRKPLLRESVWRKARTQADILDVIRERTGGVIHVKEAGGDTAPAEPRPPTLPDPGAALSERELRALARAEADYWDDAITAHGFEIDRSETGQWARQQLEENVYQALSRQFGIR